MRSTLRRTASAVACTFLCAIVAYCGPADRRAIAAGASTTRPWLFVSDIHLDVNADADGAPGDDTNEALFRSFLAEAHAVDPDPPVVVIGGDFIAHHAYKAQNAATMARIARDFDRTFPHAQFVITLGNNDSACGDYAAPVGGQFLRLVARAWAPLVDRNGAAPDFVKRFSHDGSYVATLPLPNLRVAVTNDNFLSLRYDGKCAGDARAPQRALATLARDLRSAPAGSRSWVLFHEPPGVDAFSTSHLTHRLFVVPFLRPDYRDALVRMLADPRSHVALVIAGHTHKFSFRVLPTAKGPGIPMLLAPSVSPIFQNAPSFLRSTVSADGELGDVTQFAFDGGRWKLHGDLASLGVDHFDAPSLSALIARMKKDPALVQTFASLYEGGGEDEIDERNEIVYLCAMKNFADPSFEACEGKSGFHFLTGRGVRVGINLGIGAVGALIVSLLVMRARRAVRA
jgi:predicted phosphodiesterase